MLIENADGEFEAYPDTLVGTDSHTTMINGIGVLDGVLVVLKQKQECLDNLHTSQYQKLLVLN